MVAHALALEGIGGYTTKDTDRLPHDRDHCDHSRLEAAAGLFTYICSEIVLEALPALAALLRIRDRFFGV